MSDFQIVGETMTSEDDSYVVACWKCAEKFDAGSARWCKTDTKLRTLECPHCGSCFCQAPFPYRRAFWNDAPRSLREHPSRFRLVGQDIVPSVVLKSAAPVADPPYQPHILIVDDEEPIRSLAACYVEQIGYKVTTVATPAEALVLADSISFDAVLTDALMPMIDGRELCRRLKEKHCDEFKVVLMTSLYTAQHFRTEARHRFKVDEYLAKPLRYDELRDALQRVAPLEAR
jgi:CheY-like chemotaxis protein/DNA-directed RNA polymerase subunit RPC12/RpoP